MSSRRQRSIPLGGRYRQVSLYWCNILNHNFCLIHNERNVHQYDTTTRIDHFYFWRVPIKDWITIELLTEIFAFMPLPSQFTLVGLGSMAGCWQLGHCYWHTRVTAYDVAHLAACALICANKRHEVYAENCTLHLSGFFCKRRRGSGCWHWHHNLQLINNVGRQNIIPLITLNSCMPTVTFADLQKFDER